MSFTRNTRIQTMDTCQSCRGKGTVEQEGKSMECPRCNGTGRDFITMGDIYKFINQELGKELRR